jgi:uncharacterized membrane protein YfcA
MTAWMALGLFLAGGLGGALNGVAGGGSFVVFPALVGAGMASRGANASTTVALLPGGLASAWAYRRDLAPIGPLSLPAMAAASLVGGAAGAGLLLATPPATFERVVPWLLLLATILLALGDRPRRLLERRAWRVGRVGTLVAQTVLAIYGGYFGGAVGLMMLAFWSLLTRAPVKARMPARTVLVCAANAAAALGFALAGIIQWGPTCVALLGGIAGGYGGARLARRLPPWLIRAGVLTICVTTTVLFMWRAYG